MHEAALVFDRLPVSPHKAGEVVLSRYLAGRRRARSAAGMSVPLSWGELVEYLDDARASEPVWIAAVRTVRRWELSRVTWRVRMAAQMVSRGWCDEDAWGLDHVLCQRLAGQLESLADQLHGWPQSQEFPTSDDWERALRATATDLRRVFGSAATRAAAEAWNAHTGDADQEQQAYERWAALDTEDAEAVTRALHWVADHHQNLWD